MQRLEVSGAVRLICKSLGIKGLIYPSSGACDCVVDLPHRSSCSHFVVCWSFGAAGFKWCSFCRLKPAKLTPLKTSRTKSPTHNELRTSLPMW